MQYAKRLSPATIFIKPSWVSFSFLQMADDDDFSALHEGHALDDDIKRMPSIQDDDRGCRRCERECRQESLVFVFDICDDASTPPLHARLPRHGPIAVRGRLRAARDDEPLLEPISARSPRDDATPKRYCQQR